jgi:hypothetical protein
MNRRNWLQLSRLLVNRYDLDYSMNSIVSAIEGEVLALQGMGILSNPAFPLPLQTSGDPGDMLVNVTAGQAHDQYGQLITVSAPAQSPAFTSDPTNPKKSYLVLQYLPVGNTLIPEPSDPVDSVYLNLADGFQLLIRDGTPSATPVYPATLPGDVILQGFLIPAGATDSDAFTFDPTVAQWAPIAGGSVDAIVGNIAYCTDVSIAAAVARLAGQNGKRILVATNQVLATTVGLTNNDWEFRCRPGVTISDGGAGTGFYVTGTGVKFTKSRFLGFTVTAINFQPAANYGLTAFNRFNTCTDEVTDSSSAGPNPAIGNISE